jgi:hypothetical protein
VPLELDLRPVLQELEQVLMEAPERPAIPRFA